MVRANPNWQKLVLEWEMSGTAVKAWCKEKQIPYGTLLTWRKRLKKLKDKAPSPFIELKSLSNNSGVSLQVSGVQIHLLAGFDRSVLMSCIDCLQRR